MKVIHGFNQTREQVISELKTRALLFVHEKTGAELLSLINDDENKVFGIAFRTPPSDSTGIAHILEHSVLCGSRKYPVKEPFVELLKGSLQTFLNAMTYPDKTCYPIASQNVQDFYNLVDVYLDAVFYPRITPFILQQEGWHYELTKPGEPIIFKGVVFNEMKGAYSSPDSLLAEYSQQSLFPDNTYGFDSGGHPREIPNLTFEQFQEFHGKYYHPTNARLYFYGNDDPEERLRLANEYLKTFDRIDIDSSVSIQPPFEEPRRVTKVYAAGGEEGDAQKGMITLNWVLDETKKIERNLSFHMLEYILLGMPGSPLRKALIESNYGEDLAGGGLGTDLQQMVFSTGLKGIDPDDAEKVEGLILDTLSTLSQKGIDPRTIEAALNTIEFSMRENNTGRYPRGLALMLRALTTWLYDGDPLALVAFENPLDAIKSHIAKNKSYFEGLIDAHLLNNPHRVFLLLKPDPGLSKMEEAEERERLDNAREAMTKEDLEDIIAATDKLKKIQETPEEPEALATIPILKRKDLEKNNRLIPLDLSKDGDTHLLYHDLFTNGIVYLDVGFNIHALPQRYLPFVRLFGRALLEMGTEEEDYVTLTQRISGKTGGIHPSVFGSATKNTEESAVWLFMRGKAMLPQSQELLNILHDVLLKVQLDNKERFRQIVLEAKARQEQMLVPAGHQIVKLRLRAHFNEADWALEQIEGISNLFFLRKLAKAVDEDWPGVLAELEEIRRILVTRNNMLINVTVEEEGWSKFQPQAKDFLSALPVSEITMASWEPEIFDEYEGMTIPAQVNYVGKAVNLYNLGYKFHGSAHVICRYIRNSWLWDRVRVQGGAYGAFSLFDRLSGILSFVSYRDPNLLQTLEAFDQSATFLRDLKLSDDELTKSIVGTIGDIDQYRLPDAKGFVSMVRHLSGETDQERQIMREEVLGSTDSEFRSFSGILEKVKEKGLVKVLGSESAIQGAIDDRPGWLNLLKVL